MAYSEKVIVNGFGDSPNIDAFGRFRISEAVNLYSNKALYTNNRNNDLFSDTTNGDGANTVFLSNEAATQLNVGTADGEYVVRSGGYFPYIPGKSQLITITGILGASKENVVRRIGFFDNNNGMYFESNDQLKCVIRSNASGSIVETEVLQENWNLDKLDGTGPSGITVDTSKIQIFVIDFQWLGAGRVRFGFNIDGLTTYCHQFVHANLDERVYIASPTLPCRYEIRNVGISASPSSMKEICVAIQSEGGQISAAYNFGASNKTATRAVTTRTPILAVRLKNTFMGKVNRMTYIAQEASYYAITNDAFFELVQVANPTDITGTFTSVSDESSAEYSTDISAITSEEEYILSQIYVTAGVANKTGASAARSPLNQLSIGNFIQQNSAGDNSDLFVIYATPFTGTSNVSASLMWLEII